MTALVELPPDADTMPKLLLRNARERGNEAALREKEFGIWQSFTWAQYAERVGNFARGLVELGLERDDIVAVLGDNRPEWLIAQLASQAVGARSLGVYQDSVASEVQYLVEFAGARFVIAEDQEQVDKLLEVWDELSGAANENGQGIANVIYYDPRGLGAYPHDFLLSFSEVERIGRSAPNSTADDFERWVEATTADDVALLSTTSGTTGKPKLAMLSHRNLLTMAHSFQSIDPMQSDDEFVSFLPLAWIGEQMIGAACGMLVGFTMNFPEEPETVQHDIREIGPHMMFSPPRIWENMVSDVQVRIEDSSWLKRKVYNWALGVGYRSADTLLEHGRLPRFLALQRWIANAVCFFWLRDKLGVRRIRRAYTGGAALGPDIFRFFHAIGVNLKQIYGQTEVSGISVAHRDDDIKFQTVGTPVPGAEVRIGEGGEILTRSPSVFLGYYKNDEATEEALREGWLYSGDAGYVDDDGHLIVIDRKKDVMELHDGTQFSPQFIENKLKFSPYVKEAVVFGGGEYPFVTSLITIDFANAGKWAERRQIPYTTFTDLAQKPEIYELVLEHTAGINGDLPESARIQRLLLLHKELDADDEELTRTRKVRRRFIADRYRLLVNALYGGDEAVEIENEITYQDGSTAVLQTRLRIAAPATA